jgi:molybdopterin-guanine dinucleotide biosynthesis protein A
VSPIRSTSPSIIQNKLQGFNLPKSWQDRVTFLYDDPSQDDSIPYITAKAKPDDNRIGPAAGLLAAYKNDPHAHWLVIACDYPLLTSDALQQLYDAYEEPVTCFVNSQEWCEPLLGIWVLTRYRSSRAMLEEDARAQAWWSKNYKGD